MLPEFEAPSESRRAIKIPQFIFAVLVQVLNVVCDGIVEPCMVHVRSDVNLQMPHAKSFLAPNPDSTRDLIVLHTRKSPKSSFAAPARMHIAGEIALRSRGCLGPLRCLRAFGPLLGTVAHSYALFKPMLCTQGHERIGHDGWGALSSGFCQLRGEGRARQSRHRHNRWL